MGGGGYPRPTVGQKNYVEVDLSLFHRLEADANQAIASRSDTRTAQAIALANPRSSLQNVQTGMGSPDSHVAVFDIYLQRLSCIVLVMLERSLKT